MGTLGGGFEFLAQWNFLELSDLLKWLGRGFNFTGAWTSQGMADIRTALGWIENAMPDGWERMKALLGMGDGGGFTYAICPGCHGDDSVAFASKRKIDFDNGNPGIGLILHETGHVVDYYLNWLGPCYTEEYWSEYGFIGVGWKPESRMFSTGLHSYYDDDFDDGFEDASYSTASIREDFADTFTAWVLLSNEQALPNGWYQPSPRRLEALTVALGNIP